MTTLRAHGSTRLRARQRGWAGIVMILVALVIVAILAKEALKAYGLAPGATATKAGTPAERARTPGASSGEALDMAAPGAASALERARGVEEMVKQQAAQREAKGDGTAQ